MKEMLLLNFPKEESGHAVTYDLIRKFDLKMNILRASIDYNAVGFMLVEVVGSEEQVSKGKEFLDTTHVDYQVIDSAIQIDEVKCIHCGACSAVCSVDALYINQEASLVFDKEKCLDCKLCITACPVRAIESVL